MISFVALAAPTLDPRPPDLRLAGWTSPQSLIAGRIAQLSESCQHLLMASFSAAWIAMSIAFGLHVVDEAATNFLDWYNPIATRIRAWLPVPFPPTFTFWPWFLGLLAVTAVLFTLTPFAIAREPWMLWIGAVFGLINVGNGLLHIVASIRFGRRVPGVISAPVLLVCAAWLLVAAVRLL